MLFKHLAVLLLPVAARAFTLPTTRSSFGIAMKSPLFMSESFVEESSGEAAAPERFTIFVGNLPLDASSDELTEVFARHGSVSTINLPTNRETGQPRGFAFVDMSSAQDMQAAITGLNGEDFNGRELRVSESVPKDQLAKKRAPTTEKNPPMAGYKKIYLGNLPFDVSRDDLSTFFASYGELQDIYIPMSSETGMGRGFAFLTMKEEDADRAIAEANGAEFGGRPIVVSAPLPAGERPQRPARDDRTKLYVGNLSFYTVKETLQEIFEEFGTVIDCYMPEDPDTGGTRGFGFVTMDKAAADRAVAEIDGCEVDGRMIRVNIAQPKGRSSR